MRKLFASEQRCVSNLLSTELHIDLDIGLVTVVEECYAQPRCRHRGPRFNVDFMLQFVSQTHMPTERRAVGSPVLPNTIGADIFLLVDKASYRPVLLHLDAGEAFPIKHFTTHLMKIEDCLHRTILGSTENSTAVDLGGVEKNCISADRLLRDARVHKSKYCRLLIVGSDACFLFFPTLATPEMRGTCHTLLDSEAGRVDCYIDGSEVVCFDGWLPVKVAESEWKLEAIWKDRQ